MGLPSAVVERRQPAVHQLHRLEEPGDGRVQDCGPGRPRQALGNSKEPPLHELRQNVKSPQILLQS